MGHDHTCWYDGHKRDYTFGFLCAVDCEGICRIAHGHQPGSVDDVTSWLNSGFHSNMPNYLLAGDKVLGDGIFARIGAPFVVPVNRVTGIPQTQIEERYNILHFWARSIVENYFGRLKLLCPILQYYTFSLVDNINLNVGSCFILTNISIEFDHPLRRI